MKAAGALLALRTRLREWIAVAESVEPRSEHGRGETEGRLAAYREVLGFLDSHQVSDPDDGPPLLDPVDPVGPTPARSFDRATSHAAARSIDPNRITDTHRAILDLMAGSDYGADGTHEGLLARYRKLQAEKNWPEVSDSGFRTRVSELVEVGLVYDTGRTHRLRSGRQAVVWNITSSGLMWRSRRGEVT